MAGAIPNTAPDALQRSGFPAVAFGSAALGPGGGNGRNRRSSSQCLRPSRRLRSFPPNVWVFDLPEDKGRHLNETILGRLAAGNSAVPGRDEHFQQTQTDLQNREVIRELSEFALSAATETSDFLKIEHDAFEAAGCWVNIGPVGAAHREHSHPNNYLSGVFICARLARRRHHHLQRSAAPGDPP